jgi:glycosyltransferase involved in cell wall biosynthesis
LPVLAKCTTITPGVDLRRFDEPEFDRPRSATRPSVLFVGGVGRQYRHKGLDVALRAFATVPSEQPDVVLDVVGPGDAAAARVLARELGVADAVRFHGPLAPEQIAERYRNATVAVLPAVNDNLPLVMLEAMAAGVPVVASTVGAIPSVITDGITGFLAPPGDVDTFARRIRELIVARELAARIRSAGRARVAEGFCWSRQAAITSEQFAAVLAGRPADG